MNQTQFQNSMNEYFDQTKKNRFKDNIKNIVILIIALIHKLVAFPYLSELLSETLKNNNMSETNIEYVLIAYLIISELFVIIFVWKIVKNIRIVNFIFALFIIAYVVIFGYKYFITTKLYDNLVNKPKASFVIEAKELCNNAKTYWQKETITDGSKQVTYTKNNGVYCDSKKLTVTDVDTNYSITLNFQGNIIDFKITNGRFQYTYSGNDLTVEDITSDKFVKVDDTNKVIIPNCSNW